jgi:hypothetical protein
LHQPIIWPVLKAVQIAHDDYRAKPDWVWLGPGPFQQIAADLTDFVLNHGFGLRRPPDAKIKMLLDRLAADNARGGGLATCDDGLKVGGK